MRTQKTSRPGTSSAAPSASRVRARSARKNHALPPPEQTSKSAVAPPSASLKKGSKGAAVDQLQRCLVKTGHLSAADYKTGPGIFGRKTDAALKRFQAESGLTADGIYGPASRAALAKALGTKPQPKPPQATGEAQGLYWSDGFKNRAALTFDDGPHPQNTPKILDILARHNAKATFFVTGANAQRYPALIKRIVAEGHTLGAHSWNHDDQAKLTQAQVEADMKRTEAAIVKALGRPYDVQQFRPPYGAMDAEVKNAARKLNHQIVLWTVDSNDWRYRNDDAAILQNVFSGSSSVHARGGTLLFHDIHPQTVRVLDDVLVRLQKSGFKIQKTDQFLYEKYGANA